MKILHTADWHLGARLVDHDRSAEHQAFLDWLLAQIKSKQVDLLIVAGDIFDSANPPQTALAQYYQFLAALVSTTPCSVLIIGGNHDSAATLNAPRDLLRSLRVHVFGAAPVNPEETLWEFPDAILCAVPFLRERDVRAATAGQSHDEVVTAIREGIRQYYHNVTTAAHAIAAGRPIIGTGHLTAIGVTTATSERQIHIGNLGAVGADCFDGFDYTALGHIHRPQSVGGRDHIRYAGSPIFLCFDETANAKQVLLLEVKPGHPVSIGALPLPVWRQLISLECHSSGLMRTLKAARESAPPGSLTPWVELTITDPIPPADLDPTVRQLAEANGVEVLKIIRPVPTALTTGNALTGLHLHETTPPDVFAEKLRRSGITPDQPEHEELTLTFLELMSHIQEEETAA
jgi:DNA repair protein SbcD/Mre11